jgi:radical SAM superfamily enzyme YgiQ (UPF0313 family)
MRVLILEHPRLPSPEHFNDIANTPLWSCLMAGYACASLRQAGFEADLLDLRAHGFAQSEERVLAAAPDLLAVHAVYFWEGTLELFASLQRLRAAGLEAAICLFGFYPTLAWRDILAAFSQVDCVAVGEPEQTLVDLAAALKDGSRPDIAGLAQRSGGAPRLAATRSPRADLDALPIPLRPHLDKEETVSLLASRGCYNACDFCLIPALGGRRNPWRGRSVAGVAGEVAGLKAAGKDDFYFVDPNFIGPGKRGRERALELAAALAGLEITYGMECRASDVDAGLMRVLARSGLTSLLLGLESGSQGALDRIGKNSTPEQNLAAIATVREAGLEPEVGFIMFEPRSTLEDLAANLAFLRRARLLDRLGRSANLLYHNQIALKGTRLYAQALADGRLQPEGLLGFEGRLIYQDPRVGWLAGAMRRLCLRVLRAMGQAASGIYWGGEAAQEPYAGLNGLLQEQFARLLSLAGSWPAEPPAKQAGQAQETALGEVEDFLARVAGPTQDT